MSRVRSYCIALSLAGLAAGCNGGTGLQNSNCPSGQTLCGTVCATLGSDPQNCGACGFACVAGQSCQSGYCKADCVQGYIGCQIPSTTGTGTQLVCINPLTDSKNCGGCSNIFDGGTVCVSGEVCSAGKCAETCSPGYTACQPKDAGYPLDAGQDAGFPYCANFLVDDLNCGGCGVVCGPGKACCQSGGFAGCVSTFFDPNNCGVCGHSCLGGTCGAGLCTPNTLASMYQLQDIKAGNGNVFFIGALSNIVQFPSVYSTPSGGGSVSQVDQSLSFAPEALAIDSSSIYWSDNQQDLLYSSPVNGGTGLPFSVGSTAMDNPLPFGVVAFGPNVYWGGMADAGVGSITVRPLNGNNPPVVIATGAWMPNGLAADNGSVYWTDSIHGNIYRVGINGGTIQTVATAQTGAAGIAVDGNNIYWAAAQTGFVVAQPLDGGLSTIIARNELTPTRLAIDGLSIFWTDHDNGLIMKAPLDGGNPLPVAAGQNGPNAIAVDSNYVYWTNANGNQVMRAPK